MMKKNKNAEPKNGMGRQDVWINSLKHTFCRLQERTIQHQGTKVMECTQGDGRWKGWQVIERVEEKRGDR
jgi:hypothetical protein